MTRWPVTVALTITLLWVLGYSYTGYVQTNCGDVYRGFIAENSIDLNEPAERIAQGDFNADGLPDFAVTFLSSPSLYIFINLGGGQFEHRTLSIGSGIVALAVADFDQNGLTDIAALGRRQLSVWGGLGDGQFEALSQRQVNAENNGVFAVDLTASDMDGDGILDLTLVASRPNHVSILRGNGTGGFNDHRVIALPDGQPTQVLTSEFNGDGQPDVLVVSSFGRTVRALMSNENAFEDVLVSDFAGSPSGPGFSVIADLENDGDQDVVIPFTSNSFPAVNVLENDGQGNFSEHLTISFSGFSFGGSPVEAQVGDFDRDDVLDVAVLELGTRVLVADGVFGFRPIIFGDFANFASSGAETDFRAARTVVADVDNDGDDDFLIVGRTVRQEGNTRVPDKGRFKVFLNQICL